MSLIREKAELAASSAAPNLQQIDPATIYLIIRVILEVIAIWKACGVTPSAAVALPKKHGILTNIKLRRIINKVLVQNAKESESNLRDELQSGVLKMAKGLKVREMTQMFEEHEQPPTEMFSGLQP